MEGAPTLLMGRIRHIDWMKGIAILFMVQVHTAAVVPPTGINVHHPLAFLAAALGGMAAPLFVTMSGWGVHASAKRKGREGGDWIAWMAPRVSILFLCQILVNALFHENHGGRFEILTPGILTLFAVSAILMPVLSKIGTFSRGILMILFILAPSVLGGHAGPEWSWSVRIHSDGLAEWFERLLINGTYPAIPWLSYTILGSLIADLKEDVLIRKRIFLAGLIFTSYTVLVSVTQNETWALTEGDAILTFFPANSEFVIVSAAIVILLQMVLEKVEYNPKETPVKGILRRLEPAGRLSLTIYVGHFALLGAFVAFYGRGSFPLEVSFVLTLIHMIVWIPISIVYERIAPNYSLEQVIRVMSRGLSR